MVLVGLVPLAVSCAVTWIEVRSARRVAHGRPGLGPHQRPPAVLPGRQQGQGLQPSVPARARPSPTCSRSGMRFSTVFPFITLPTSPAAAYGRRGAGPDLSDGQHPGHHAAALPPQLWGPITAFRRRPSGRSAARPDPDDGRRRRSAGVLLWGYIADRYMADVLPLLVVAGAVGLVDIWRRAGGRTRNTRAFLVGAVAVLGCVQRGGQRGPVDYARWAVDIRTGRPVRVDSASVSPVSLAAGIKRVRHAGLCSGRRTVRGGRLRGHVSVHGCSFKAVPGQQIQHFGWIPVEQGPGIDHTVAFKFNVPVQRLRAVPLVTYGPTKVVLMPNGRRSVPTASGERWSAHDHVALELIPLIPMAPNVEYQFTVMTDPYLHSIRIERAGGGWLIDHYLPGTGPGGREHPTVVGRRSLPAGQRR